MSGILTDIAVLIQHLHCIYLSYSVGIIKNARLFKDDY
jgi:hypothetical protein